MEPDHRAARSDPAVRVTDAGKRITTTAGNSIIPYLWSITPSYRNWATTGTVLGEVRPRTGE